MPAEEASKNCVFFFLGSNINLGKMEINSVAGLTSLTQNTPQNNDNPSVRDIDTPTDEQDENGKLMKGFDH